MAGVGDLIGQSVWDSEGVWVGQVVDVRMRKNRRADFGMQQQFTVSGLVVSHRRAPVMLGRTRDPGNRTSWLFKLLSRTLYTGSSIVSWDAVASTGNGEITLRKPAKALQRV
ncbi:MULTISPECIES: hypothetical protein [Streptosporangium]|uniref:Sporulation protein YlmC with PRC-barrel domain n=1 Tax=Streptosporangium brasiliense TaxID=47480 RepID=A0ABT9QV18_9ACTN|nr:hypothetical protein [Streptosporangium brasiliense]MDP9860833.1 sporulation protein YlmC with PRC-barrel domain [Streptosporangium brasiliense]